MQSHQERKAPQEPTAQRAKGGQGRQELGSTSDLSDALRMLRIDFIRLEKVFLQNAALEPSRIAGRYVDEWIRYPDKIEQVFPSEIEKEKHKAASQGQTFDNNGTYSLRRMAVSRPENEAGERTNIYQFDFYPSDYERFVYPNKDLDAEFFDPDSGETISRREATGLLQHRLRFSTLEEFPFHFHVGVNGVFISSDNHAVVTSRSKRQLIVGGGSIKSRDALIHVSVAEGMYRSRNKNTASDLFEGSPHPYATLIRGAKRELGLEKEMIDSSSCRCIAFAMDQLRAQPLFLFFSALKLKIEDIFLRWQFFAEDKHENDFIIGLPWTAASVQQLMQRPRLLDLNAKLPENMDGLVDEDNGPRLRLASNHAQLSFFVAACHSFGIQALIYHSPHPKGSVD